ncbi:Bug family tripartite tricarboxylate transporter substrate binding protein [Oricola thermophila]|uniref:Tripartite tricarboxylate transporter substrate binding protein n=1 Tax=Oricola thermophila TaxID=2742145 RepID=A0A6N1VH69_9HYPH|nr:tripartite tricarboxylate transporter substrate-binding protein [Oricola thermophila]QKV19025.1 tripartite tricarboxylate transporter substrate binding protein [Oricola thermophila]
MPIRRHVLATALGLCASLLSGASFAQSYPEKPITVVVPFSAGGATDSIARMVTGKISEQTGATFVIENRPGMGGSVGAQSVASAAADGYTILTATPGVQILNPFLYSSLPYDAAADFQPVADIGMVPNLLVVNPEIPVETVPEFIEYLKAHPDEVSFSSSGVGSSSHLAGELFKSMADVDIQHIPYQGTGAAIVDLVAGRVEMAIDSYSAMMPLVKDGSMRLLAVGTPDRVATQPDLPTIDETLPGFVASGMVYVIGPDGMPDEAVNWLNAAINDALADPAVSEKLASMSVIVKGGTPEDLDETVSSARALWSKVIGEAGISIK